MQSLLFIRLTRFDLQAIDNVIVHIEQHHAGKITAFYLADRFQISIKKLQSAIKKRTGQSIHEYLLSVRLNKAKDMLEDDKPLKQTVLAIG
jgi:transcriptional regulator GlxA family with amidase domain